MLPPFIIEQIRQREERERARKDEQPRLELPIPNRAPNRGPASSEPSEDDADRGVIILDLL